MANRMPPHILKLTSEEKRKFLESFDYVFSDIDGVIWNTKQTINGAPAGFKVLQDCGKRLNFITNNSLRPADQLESKFKSLGLDIKQDEIWHPAKSIVAYLQGINFEGLIYVIGTEIFKNILKTAGYNVIDGPNMIFEESLAALAPHIFDRQPVRAVVMDVDINLSAAKLIRAQLYLHNPECLFIAGATDMQLNITENLNIIGPGQFMKMLESCCKREAIQLGKPGKPLAEMLKQYFGITDPQRVLMIGDTLEQDMAFAKTCNFQSLLVLTGCCKLADIEKTQTDSEAPDYYADGMLDFVEFAKDLNKANV